MQDYASEADPPGVARNPMRYFFLIILILTIPTYAAIYKWTDHKGRVHYSDKPQEGAKKIKEKDLQSYTPVPAPDIVERPAPEAAPRAYDLIAVTQPLNEDTLRNNTGTVVVTVSLEPFLQEGDRIQVILDEHPIGEPQPGTPITLHSVDRGTHTVAVQVKDPRGEVIGESQTVVFHLHRPRENMPSGPYPFPLGPSIPGGPVPTPLPTPSPPAP